MSKTTQRARPAFAPPPLKSSEAEGFSAHEVNRPQFVKRMADARVARQKVLEDREPTNPISLSQVELERRILSRAMPHLDAAIARSRAPETDLPSLVSQEELSTVPEKGNRGFVFWAAVILLGLISLGLIAFAALTYTGTDAGGLLRSLIAPAQ